MILKNQHQNQNQRIHLTGNNIDKEDSSSNNLKKVKSTNPFDNF